MKEKDIEEWFLTHSSGGLEVTNRMDVQRVCLTYREAIEWLHSLQVD